MKKAIFTFLFLSVLTLSWSQNSVSLHFDGTDDYVSVPDNNAIDFRTSLTLEAWVKPTGTQSATAGIISKNRASGSIGYALALEPGNELTFLANNNTTNVYVKSTTALPLNQWSHVAVTYNGSIVRLYYNGVEVYSQSVSITLLNSTQPLYIGGIGSGGTSTWVFKGNIDEVRLWNTARSASAISAAFKTYITGSQSNLIAAYSFTNGTANGNNAGVTTLTNSTGTTSLNGTLANFALSGTSSNWVDGACIADVNITAAPDNIITPGTSVTFTATPVNGGTTPQYQWKKNGVDVGTNSATYFDASLVNNDVISCVLTSSEACAAPATTTNSVTMTVSTAAALSFDGSNDIVSFSQAPTTVTNNFTVETWFKWSGGGSDFPTLVAVGNGTNNGYGIQIDKSASNIGWIIGGLYGTAPTPIVANTWTHVALVRDNGSMRFYVNGSLITGSTTTITPNTPVGGLFGNGYEGLLDETRIWSRALTQCEIQNYMNCELSNGQTGLAAYYKYNQGVENNNNSGITTLNDASGNNKTGTLTNFNLTGATSNWVGTGSVTRGVTCGAYTTYYTWTGTTSTDWSTASNWSCGVVPTATSNVTIPTTTNAPTLPANLTIANLSLTGTNKVILGTSNLTVDALTGGNSSSYIVTDGTGTLTIKNVGTTATLFPIGPSTTVYAPVTITNNISRDFAVKVGTSITNPITDYKYVNLQWDITPSVLTGNSATLALGWSSSSQAAGFSPTSAVQVNHYNTSTSSWDMTYSANVSGSDPYTATALGVSHFSPFSLSNVAVLSVEWLSFTGYNKGSANILNWQTVHEVNNKGFQVERLNGSHWQNIGFVTANNKASNYQFLDNFSLWGMERAAYYRLRQIDNDGKETFSKIISIDINKDDKLITYPNPVSDVLTVDNTEGGDFQIFNLLGQLVLKGKTSPLGTERLDVSALSKGTYLLKVGAEQTKFVKQ